LLIEELAEHIPSRIEHQGGLDRALITFEPIALQPMQDARGRLFRDGSSLFGPTSSLFTRLTGKLPELKLSN
jgi:hypothetical protein